LRSQFRFAPCLLQRRLRRLLRYNSPGRARHLQLDAALAVAAQAEAVAEPHIHSTPRPIPRKLRAASFSLE
jgi:hypothetical protein